MTRLFSFLLTASFIVSQLSYYGICETRPEPVQVTIDLTSRQTPISPYIYGQFIEHLGRCIYGGLWSEMLEDRKFFHPITGQAPSWALFKPGNRSWDGEGHPYELLTRSPWLILGDRKTVKMDSVNPYVGEHTPQISGQIENERTGIYQERLHLKAGREYTGRIVFRTDSSHQRISLSLTWGIGAGDRTAIQIQNLDSEYQTHHFRFTAERSTDNGRLEIVNNGSGTLWIGAVSLMPSDNLYGWRADTVSLLRELNSPVYRWPGGNFVSGYNWKDGIGDPDKRPPRKNPAWKGIEHNDVGLHEYIISGENRWSRNDPEKPRQVDIKERSLFNPANGLDVVPLSVTLFVLDIH